MPLVQYASKCIMVKVGGKEKHIKKLIEIAKIGGKFEIGQ